MTSIDTTSVPRPNDLFSRVDSDRSGGVSQPELQKLSDTTGKSIDAGAEAFKGYDSDSNGSLSGEELKNVLDNSGFGPPLGMQGVAPPPPPPQLAADSYSENLPYSAQNILTDLVSSLQDLMGMLKGSSESGQQGPPPPGGAPRDIFGMVDTDRNGALSKDELQKLAKTLKETTGQTLDVSEEGIKALDRNGDGELSPDELDLRKTLSLKSANLGGDSGSEALKNALEQNWQQDQSGEIGSGNSDTRMGALLNQVKSINNILESLIKNVRPGTSGTDPLFSIKS